MSAWEAPGATDEWYTPKAVFDALGCRFDLDVAAPFAGPLYVPCDGWIYDRSLERHWSGFIWANFPFGGRNGLAPWLAKFFKHGNGIALTPDRTSAPWFQTYAPMADAILFTRKIRFLRPDGTEGKSPSTGTALMAVGERGVEALVRAAGRNFGMLVLPAHPHSLPHPSPFQQDSYGFGAADGRRGLVFNHVGVRN